MFSFLPGSFSVFKAKITDNKYNIFIHFQDILAQIRTFGLVFVAQQK
jgi:hypothetical protein